MKNKILRRVGGAIIGLCGFCTIATVDQGLKNVEIKGRCGNMMKSVGRYTMIHLLYAVFILAAYKLLDVPFNKAEASKDHKDHNDTEFDTSDDQIIYDDDDDF